nr:hypothetical protein [Tanacetum cinerariifolium]
MKRSSVLEDSLCYDDDNDEETSTPLRNITIFELPLCIAITLVLSTKETKDFLIMEEEHLDIIPEKESDEFIKSSVENLVPNPKLMKPTVILRKKIIISRNYFTIIHLLIPPKENNSENSDAVIESISPSPIPVEDSDPFMEEIDLFLNFDGSIPPGIDSDYSDSEGDNLFPERLLQDDSIPLMNILDFSNVV